MWDYDWIETIVPSPWSALHLCVVLAWSTTVPRPGTHISLLAPDSDRWSGGVQDGECRGKRSFGRRRGPCRCSWKEPWVGWWRKIEKAKVLSLRWAYTHKLKSWRKVTVLNNFSLQPKCAAFNVHWGSALSYSRKSPVIYCLFIFIVNMKYTLLST